MGLTTVQRYTALPVIRVRSLVSIAQAVLLLERGQTDTDKQTGKRD